MSVPERLDATGIVARTVRSAGPIASSRARRVVEPGDRRGRDVGVRVGLDDQQVAVAGEREVEDRRAEAGRPAIVANVPAATSYR